MSILERSVTAAHPNRDELARYCKLIKVYDLIDQGSCGEK
jgi:hypothetical protein